MPFGPWELVIILVILVLIFGASRLSQVGGAVGKSVREFRSAVQEEPQPAPAPAPAPSVPPVACPSCQALNTPTNKFCSACGATFTAPAPPAVAEPQPVATALEQPASEKAEPVEAETPAVEKADADKPAAEKAAIDRPPAMPKVLENTCPSCATVNPPGQPFCGQCGTRLTHAAA